MKTLLILRHAEPLHEAPDGSDFSRALTDLGRAQAAAQGRFLAQYDLLPQRVLCSAAVRAVDTAQVLAEACQLAAPVEAAQELYNAPGETLLKQLQALQDECARVLLVAHMPGVAHLVSLLTTEHVDLSLRYVPGALARVEVDADTWWELDYGTGTLELFLPALISSE